jgi:hypothetical protein
MFNLFYQSRCNSQHNAGGDLYDSLITWRIFTLTTDIPYKLQNSRVSDYGHDLDLLVTAHWLHVSYPKTSGCRDKFVPLRPTYINIHVTLLKAISTPHTACMPSTLISTHHTLWGFKWDWDSSRLINDYESQRLSFQVSKLKLRCKN